MPTINNDYNRVQINETIDKDANGNVYKRSLMLNIREESVAKAEELYLDLKRRLNGTVVVHNNKSERNNGKGPVCDLCGSPMIKRHGRKGEFYGCSGFPNCTNTKPLEQVAELELVPF
jgi:hypothetical protein